jgi:hypothetical protein
MDNMNIATMEISDRISWELKGSEEKDDARRNEQSGRLSDALTARGYVFGGTKQLKEESLISPDPPLLRGRACPNLERTRLSQEQIL